MRVGQEYRIVPVGLPNGVFHPKCIHLCSDDEQLLLVGSGNVTFGGHGRNAEVFEALVPNEHATAFSDFSVFLENLGSSPNIQIARREWIDDFAGRANEAARLGADSSDFPVRLIHPIARTALDQLEEAADTLGACRKVKIISPYYDPDGEAVESLLNGLDAEKGIVAVTDEGKSQFPFVEAQRWSRTVLPEKPEIIGKRFVHAKWIECDFLDGTLLLTGSFNATRKALTTTDNVELGVLRRMKNGHSLLKWESCDPPMFEPAQRLPSGLGKSEIVYAGFDRNDPAKLTDQLISLQPVSGEWFYRVVQADGTSYSGEVVLKDDGRFAVIDQELEMFSELPALQIVLQFGDREARGWIHNEMLLSVGARRRLTAGALIVKNAAILSLFAAATEDTEFLHPRFLLMDNVEDKGMEQERSHNFQKIMVEASEAAKLDHQIIFTTSMINPDLDEDQYTIGPQYTHGDRTLRKPSDKDSS